MVSERGDARSSLERTQARMGPIRTFNPPKYAAARCVKAELRLKWKTDVDLGLRLVGPCRPSFEKPNDQF